MPDPMNSSIVEQALRRLGEGLDSPRDIEILVVGGAAGMLTGVLPASRVTIDCDVMVSVPPEALPKLERAAGHVADELGLPSAWLNGDAQLRRDALPDGWEQRRVLVGQYGPLRVFAASRIDLIAMKVLAGRDQDIEDLHAMRLLRDDMAFVIRYLDALGNKGTLLEQIQEARLLLDSLEVHEHE